MVCSTDKWSGAVYCCFELLQYTGINIAVAAVASTDETAAGTLPLCPDSLVPQAWSCAADVTRLC
jgi:hypothetical protein